MGGLISTPLGPHPGGFPLFCFRGWDGVGGKWGGDKKISPRENRFDPRITPRRPITPPIKGKKRRELPRGGGAAFEKRGSPWFWPWAAPHGGRFFFCFFVFFFCIFVYFWRGREKELKY
eukprot:FR735987.1.p3 GENE.FR735987.1~~FR735987.1.p3  ORF type:complete len:119 (-),score=58.54 FR735987.1:787-1143(-)